MSLRTLETILARNRFTPNRKKVVYNLYWAVLGKCLTILSELFVGIFIARILGPEQFGLMNYVISYVMLFSVFANFGLDGIEIRELSKPGADRGGLLGTALVLRVLFSLLTILLIILTLWRFEPDRYTTFLILIYSSSLFFNTLAVFRNYFTSVILHEYVVKSEMCRTVIGACIKLLILWHHPSLTWLLTAFALDFLLVGIGYIRAYRLKADQTITRWNFKYRHAKMLVQNSLPLMFSGAAFTFYQRINEIMIRNFLDEASVGHFAVASKLIKFSIFIPLILAQSTTPLLVKAYNDSPQTYSAKRKEFMDWMVWSGIAMSLIIFLTASPVIKVLYGADYHQAIPVLQILAWKTMFMSLANGSGQIILTENLQKFAIYRNLMGCTVSIIGNFFLIPVWGVPGSAFVVVLTVFVAGFISNLLIKPYRSIFFLQLLSLRTGLSTIYRQFKHTR